MHGHTVFAMCGVSILLDVIEITIFYVKGTTWIDWLLLKGDIFLMYVFKCQATIIFANQWSFTVIKYSLNAKLIFCRKSWCYGYMSSIRQLHWRSKVERKRLKLLNHAYYIPKDVTFVHQIFWYYIMTWVKEIENVSI